MAVPQTLPELQTTPALKPNKLLKEMGFDISPTTSTSSNSTVSPTTVTTVMDEKKYNLNICLFHLCNLELFQSMSNMQWYVKCPFSGKCVVFTHRNEQNGYMGVLNRKVHDIYRNLKGTVTCECNRTTKTVQRIWQVLKLYFNCKYFLQHSKYLFSNVFYYSKCEGVRTGNTNPFSNFNFEMTSLFSK